MLVAGSGHQHMQNAIALEKRSHGCLSVMIAAARWERFSSRRSRAKRVGDRWLVETGAADAFVGEVGVRANRARRLTPTIIPEGPKKLPFDCQVPCATTKNMLGEYKVGRCSRQCYHEKRPLKEGEWYYSVVLMSDDDDYQRRDYSSDAWEGPPEGSLGHWKCRMPIAGEKKLVLAPRAVLIDLLRQMESIPEQSKTRFLLALILLRRRFVRLCDGPTASKDPAEDPKDAPMVKVMHLEVVDDGSTIDVVECDIARSEAESLSESLSELLYCEASEIQQE
jgi:hypothetical protein